MREFGKVKSSLWMSEKFQKLDDDFARLFYIYLLTNQHGNALGCYRIHIGYMMADLDRSEVEIMDAMTRCTHGGLTVYDTVSKTVFITDFLLHSPPSNQSHAKKVFSDTLSIREEKFRYLVLLDLSNVCKLGKITMDPIAKAELDTLSTRCTHGGGEGVPTKTQTQTVEKDTTVSQKKSDPDPKKLKNEISSPEVQMAHSIYNDLARQHGYPLAVKLTEDRRKKLKSRIEDAGGLDGWRSALERVEKSPFLRGKGPRGWKPNLDFFLQQQSFIKLMEGAYDETDRPDNSGNSTKIRAREAIQRGLGSSPEPSGPTYAGPTAEPQYDPDTGEIVYSDEGRSAG